MSDQPVSAVPVPHDPLTFRVDPTTEPRNKLTVGFRVILAIPHSILVGPGGLGILGQRFVGSFGGVLSNGVLGTAAGVCAFISWFAILFTGKHPEGLRDFCRYYLRWYTRALAYQALFRDEYPPFGEGEYPAEVDIAFAEGPRDKLSVALRIFYVIPHVFLLFFLGAAWFVTSVIAWFAILFTGEYPPSLYKFGIGVMRWGLRVQAYFLLFHDVYPPFSLD